MRHHGEGSVFRRGRVWYVQYSHNGRVIQRSSKSIDKTTAVRFLRRVLSEQQAGRHAPDAGKVTLAELRRLVEEDHLLNGRRAARPPARAWRHLEEHFGPDCVAQSITFAQLKKYAAARHKAKAAPATYHYELAILRRGYVLACESEILPSRPAFPKAVFQNARQGWASEGDLQALLKQLPEYARPPVRFAYITGWRMASEVLPLRWAQVSANAIRLEPGTTKSGEGREWPLDAHAELAGLIEAQRAYTDEVQRRAGQIVPWLFHRDGQQIKSISMAWKGACKRAGLKLIPHDLRRTAVRNLERAGVPRTVAMRLVGHQTEQMYRRYSIVAPQDLADGVAKLAALHGAAPDQARSSVTPLKAAKA